MPRSDWAYGDEAWHVMNLVRSWSSDSQRQRAEMWKFRIVARRVPQLPEHPDSGTWRLAQPVNLHLMPLWWRTDRPEEITVRALHPSRRGLALVKRLPQVWPGVCRIPSPSWRFGFGQPSIGAILAASSTFPNGVSL